jgi:hypothetical protein
MMTDIRVLQMKCHTRIQRSRSKEWSKSTTVKTKMRTRKKKSQVTTKLRNGPRSR